MLIASLLRSAAVSTPIPLATAHRIFDEMRLASEEDGGRLWGRPLYGPMIFVDPTTHYPVANLPDSTGALTPLDGVFAGVLPDSVVVANTDTSCGGIASPTL